MRRSAPAAPAGRARVAVVRDQPIDDDDSPASCGASDSRVHGRRAAGADRPELNIVSNLGRRTPPRSVFHIDTTYVRRPPAYTALRAVQVPAAGGDTLFTNQYRAYRILSDVPDAAWPGGPSPMSSPASTRARAKTMPPSTRCPPAPAVRTGLAVPVHTAALRGDQRDGRRGRATDDPGPLRAFHPPDNIYRHRWRPATS